MEVRELNELRSLEELAAYQTEVRGRIVELDKEYDGLPFPDDDTRGEYVGLKDQDAEIDKRIAELRERKRTVEQYATNGAAEPAVEPFRTRRPGATTADNIWDLSTVPSSLTNPERQANELRDRALRAVELARYPHTDRQDAQRQAADLVDKLDGGRGVMSRHILETGSPTYKRAFGKAVAGAHLTSEESRALSLTGASGGFAVPFELDPTIINTSSGVVNPIRAISRVIPITTDEWKGVTSTGITATYEAEATETTDNAPTLVQPTISTEKAQAFVPFSIEVGQDWTGLQAEMGELLQDAKDTLEATKFATGSGTNEPFGVVTGTTNTVNAATGQTFTLANLYSLKNALPPRHRSRAAFIGDLAILDRIRQFDTVGSSAQIWVDSLQDDVPARLLGRPVYEASEMADTPATGSKFLIFGDFSRYVIIDRIGLTVELIPHLMGANRRPTGQRGLYAFWRNGAKVVDATAFRALIGVA